MTQATVSHSGRLRPTFSIFLLALLWVLLARNSTLAAELHRFDFAEPHMGTVWSFTCYGTDIEAAKAAARLAFDQVDRLERAMTDYNPESELIQLGKATAGIPHPVSKDLLHILQASGRIHRQSHGAFDVTAGPLIQVWRRARRQKELPSSERVAEAIALVGWPKVRLDRRRSTVTLSTPAMRLDLGGIAKGYAADAALRILRDRGFPSSLVAASGDLAIGDAPPGKAGWPIRIGDPVGRTNVLGLTLFLKNAGVSTSGDAEQFVEIQGVRYSHIVDPSTGSGLTNRLQATVIAECATRSDALATAVCILGVEKGTRMVDADRRLSALMVFPSGEGIRSVQTRRFPRP